MLKTIDPDNTHIPLKNSATKERMAVFFTLEPSRVDFIARMKNTIIRAMWKSNPLNAGSPRVFTKKRSNLEDIITTPGLIPYIRSARMTTELITAVIKPFHENVNFLK
jgi:hypothetical protein